jgi:hypothetical protein
MLYAWLKRENFAKSVRFSLLGIATAGQFGEM